MVNEIDNGEKYTRGTHGVTISAGFITQTQIITRPTMRLNTITGNIVATKSVDKKRNVYTDEFKKIKRKKW